MCGGDGGHNKSKVFAITISENGLFDPRKLARTFCADLCTTVMLLIISQLPFGPIFLLLLSPTP